MEIDLSSSKHEVSVSKGLSYQTCINTDNISCVSQMVGRIQDCLEAIEDKMDSAFARLDSQLQSLEAQTVLPPVNMVTFFLIALLSYLNLICFRHYTCIPSILVVLLT